MAETDEHRPLLLRLRPPLRWRVAIAFALVTLTITGLLAFVTWRLTSSYLVDQREQSAVRQATANARLVTDTLVHPVGGDLQNLLTGLAGTPDLTVAVRGPGGWTSAGRRLDVAALSPALLDPGPPGTPVTQRIVADGIPVMAVALTLPGTGSPTALPGTGSAPDLYVQLFPLVELDHTLSFLGWVLVTGVAIGTLLGSALGGWAGRQALRPLTELTDAAARVAAGDLRARLPEHGDPDLAALAATFNRTAADLERRVSRDARFAGDVSHELRSPLTTLLNAVAVLRRRRAELPPPAQQAVDLLDADVHRFQSMVVDLLEISRDDRVDARDLEPVDVPALVRRAVAGREGVRVDVCGDPPSILADRRRLDRVVGNLLENADTHGGGAVRVGVLRREGGVRIEVDDAGPGVPPHLREEVFERFARGLTAGRRGDHGGTGLGLAVVARHVRSHHGGYWIEDSPQGGARVVVEFPDRPARRTAT